MDKKLLLGVIPVMLSVMLLSTASTVTAQPGPWNSEGAEVEVIPYYNGETLLRKWTGDGGFQLWITGNRELHCVYKLMGQNDGDGWSGPSTWMKYDLAHGGDGLDYLYKCEPFE